MSTGATTSRSPPKKQQGSPLQAAFASLADTPPSPAVPRLRVPKETVAIDGGGATTSFRTDISHVLDAQAPPSPPFSLRDRATFDFGELGPQAAASEARARVCRPTGH
jgi:hypothetical protein